VSGSSGKLYLPVGDTWVGVVFKHGLYCKEQRSTDCNLILLIDNTLKNPTRIDHNRYKNPLLWTSVMVACKWYIVPPGMTLRILCHHQNGKVSFNGWSWKCFLTDIPWQWCFAEIATAITLGTTTAIISLHELHFPGLQIWRSVGAVTAINHVASCTFSDCRFIKVSTPSIDLKISCLLNKEFCYMYRFFVLLHWQKNWHMLVSKDKLCDHNLVVITYISMDSFVLVYWQTLFLKDKLCDHNLVVITYISMDSFVLFILQQ